MIAILHVAVLNTPADFYTYLPGELSPKIGARVWVSFRNKQRLGVVVGKDSVEKLAYRCLPVSELIDEEPLLGEALLKLARFGADYYQSPLCEFIACLLPKNLRLAKPCVWPKLAYYRLLEPSASIAKNATKQQKIIEILNHYPQGLDLGTLKSLGADPAVLTRLSKKNILEKTLQEVRPIPPNRDSENKLTLNDEQDSAVSTISRSLDSYQAFLLHGVTGSGKTEVYLQVIATVLAQQKQVLILVPEIGLTPQLVSRFERRFAVVISTIHSNLNDSERLHAFLAAKEGHAKIIIGTRSALFTPMPNLGLIVIDEEHDSSFKQQGSPHYHARDLAMLRAYHQSCPIILGSATPTLESLHNVELKKIQKLSLKHRAKASKKTHYKIQDLRTIQLKEGFAEPVLKAIKQHLDNNNQVLVFINRRGFAPILICHQCGWSAACHHCSAKLTVHAKINKMRCHHCGYQRSMQKNCGDCKSNELIPLGIGTERVADFLTKTLPAAKVLRIDRDTTKGKKGFEEKLALINQGEVNCLVGTQMLAKGHHFPRLSLVVVLDADQGFYSPDFRAVEKLGQLLLQVAGRAGRESIEGEVIIQTHLPKQPQLQSLIQYGFDDFAKNILAERKVANLPPFNHLAIIEATSRYQDRLMHVLHSFKQQLKSQPTNHPVTVWGPANAPMEKKAGQFQMQLLVQSSCRYSLAHSLKKLRALIPSIVRGKRGAGVFHSINVDPS